MERTNGSINVEGRSGMEWDACVWLGEWMDGWQLTVKLIFLVITKKVVQPEIRTPNNLLSGYYLSKSDGAFSKPVSDWKVKGPL